MSIPPLECYDQCRHMSTVTSPSSLLPLRSRDEELTRLRAAATAATSGKPQLVVLSGLRRVGKTFLLQHFLEGLRSTTTVYFEATQAGQIAQLRRFGETLRRAAVPGDDVPPIPAFGTWEDALQFCVFLARSRPLAVVIDEVTYLMTSSPGFTSTVQAVWDSIASSARGPALTLVLSGSAVGIVEDALDYRGALYRRPTLLLRLEPFSVAQAYRYSGMPEPSRLMEAYSACGGYPLHLDAWDFDRTTDGNLARLAGSPGGLLIEDGAALLAGLPDQMRRVLLAVGQGRSRRNEIADDVGARVDRPLEAVQRARLVQGFAPLGAPQKARPLYRVPDPFLRFWLRLLANHVQRIEAGQGPAVLQHGAGEWQHHLGVVFEQAAREHAIRLERDGTLPSGTLVGEWWSVSGQPCQVDVLGLHNHRTVAVGEARWQRQPLSSADVDALARSLRRVPDPVAQPLLLLWSRGGVRPEVAVGPVRGYELSDMLVE